MALATTKYPNNIREVSGLAVNVVPDDVYIEVDTTAGPCTITLEQIPASNWEVLYKLYIYDKNNNATANNITIQTQAGQTINQLGSIVIDQDGAGVVIKILGENRYVGNYSYAGVVPPGSDELVKVTGADTTAAYLAFKAIGGNGVTTQVLNPGANEALQFNFSGYIETLTFAQFQVLVAGSAVQEGIMYNIIDAGLTNLGVFCLGLSNTQVSSNGHGSFLNNDYQNLLGNFAGVWFAGIAGLVAGTSMVAWNGEMYESVTGAAGADPSIDAVNWLVKPRNTDPGQYIQEFDRIIYDQVANEIVLREDRRNNLICRGQNAAAVSSLDVASFQWGNDTTFGNKALGRSWIGCVNNRGTFRDNMAQDACNIDAINNVGIIQNNVLNNVSTLNVTSMPVTGSCLQNTLSNNGRLQMNNYTGTCIENNLSEDSEIDITSCTAPFVSHNLLAGQSEIQAANCVAVIQNNSLRNASVITCTNAIGGTIRLNVLEQQSTINALTLQNGQIEFNNLVINSTINCTNSRGAITNNGLSDTSVIHNNTGGAASDLDHNLLFQESEIEATLNNNQLKNNRLENSHINAGTNLGHIIENKLVNDCTITATNNTIDGSIDTNYLFNGCTIDATTNDETIDKNIMHNDCSIDGASNSGSITNNVLENDSVLTATNNTAIIDTNRILNDSTLTLTNNTGLVTDNQLTNECIVNGINNTGSIWHNICSDGGRIHGNNNAGVIGQFGDDTSGNIVRQKSELDVRDQTALGQTGGNELYDLSFLTFQDNSDSIKKNTIITGGITGGTNTDPINFNFVKSLNIQLGNNATPQLRFTAMAGANNWPITLDMDNIAIFNGGVLTLAFTTDEFGIVNLENSSGKTISQIQNLNVAFNTTIINTDTAAPAVRINVVAIGAAASIGQVVGAVGAGFQFLQGYATANDSIVMRRNGIFAQIIGTPDILT